MLKRPHQPLEDECPVDDELEDGETINTVRGKYLNFFLCDLDSELSDIERTLESEASKIVLNWVRDKIYRLQEEYINANV